MQAAAADPTERHAAITALSAYDTPRLPALIAMRDAMHGRWQVDDTDARDAVLAAIQLQAATDAQGELLADWKTVRDRVTKATSMPVTSEWCGMFSGDHLIRAALDADFRSSFMHTHNVEAFFTYHPEQFPTRIPKWIWDEDGWEDVRGYHNARGALRTWLGHARARPRAGTLDIQPGDMVLIDWNLDGDPDHIVLASSYDPATGYLVTIGGNDSGYVVVPPDKHKEAEGGRQARRGGGGDRPRARAGRRRQGRGRRQPGRPAGQGEAGRGLRRRAPVADRPRGAHVRVQAAGQAAAASEAREVSSKSPPPSQPAGSEIPPRSEPSTTARSRGSA